VSRFYPSQPVVGVGIVIWKEDQFCLIKRSAPPRAGQLSLPGGGQKLGETYFETARRETMEETKLVIEVLGLINVVDSIHHDDQGRVKQHYTLVDVYARWVSGEPQGGSDASDAYWYRYATLESLKLWSETERVIKQSYKLWQSANC
jgi:ADP-ribose pyrophosphatase YjhB (NUDIX family)